MGSQEVSIRLHTAALLLLLAFAPPAALARLQIVATSADLASLARSVGGERVEAASLVPPALDAETFEPGPKELKRLTQAQLLVRVGLGYDPWLDRALAQNANAGIQRGAAGYVDASTGIALLEITATVLSPAAGHAHGAGNPHYWLDPLNAEIITASILEGLTRVDPEHAAQYARNRSRFLADLRQRLAAWEQRLAPYRGAAVITYHSTWPYFARRFRLNIVGFIEPRPGVPPSPNHLAALLRTAHERRVAAILRGPSEPVEAPGLIAAKTGARIVLLAPAVGSLPQAPDYLSLFEYDVGLLHQALGGGVVRPWAD